MKNLYAECLGTPDGTHLISRAVDWCGQNNLPRLGNPEIKSLVRGECRVYMLVNEYTEMTVLKEFFEECINGIDNDYS